MQVTERQKAQLRSQARRRLWGLSTPGRVRDPITEGRMRASVARRLSTRQPIDRILAQNPNLAALRPTELAARLHVHPTQALAALSRRAGRMRPQSLTPQALRMVAAFSPAVPLGLFRRDTRGFEQSGGGWIYIVEKGDNPYALASKYAPGGKARAGTTYRQLLKANPNYPLNAKKDNFKNFWAGMKLKWPEGWSVPTAATPVEAPSTAPTAPTPVIPEAAASLASIVQAKALLATWGASDGASEPGVTRYGQSTEDLTTTWTARDKLQLTSFARWSNSARGTSLDTDGSLDAEHLAALKSWAEQKARAPQVPAVTKTTTTPKATPATPVTTPTVKLPTVPRVTVDTKPPVIEPVPEILTTPPGPAIAAPTPVQQAEPVQMTPAPQSPKKEGGGGALALIALAGAFAAGIL